MVQDNNGNKAGQVIHELFDLLKKFASWVRKIAVARARVKINVKVRNSVYNRWRSTIVGSPDWA